MMELLMSFSSEHSVILSSRVIEFSILKPESL